MVSQIDPSFPVAGIDQPSQGFRTNFNFAKLEIEALQNEDIVINGQISTLQSNVSTLQSDVTVLQNNLSGIVFDDLTDVEFLTAPQDMEVLRYDAGTGKWTNVLIPTGGLGSVEQDPSPTLGADLDASGFRIINLPTPALAAEAATKAYVDSNAISELSDDPSPVLASSLDTQGFSIISSSGNITLAPFSDVSVNNKKIIDLADPTNPQDAATRSFVESTTIGSLSDDGSPTLSANLDVDTFSIITTQPGTDLILNSSFGNVDVSNTKIINLATPTLDTDAVTKLYVDTAIDDLADPMTGFLMVDGGVMMGLIDMNSFPIINLPIPSLDSEAANKEYVDMTTIGSLAEDSNPAFGGDVDLDIWNLQGGPSGNSIIMQSNTTLSIRGGGSVIEQGAFTFGVGDISGQARFVVKGQTTGTIMESLSITSAGTDRPIIPNNTAVHANIVIIGRRTDADESAFWRFETAIDRFSGNAGFVGSSFAIPEFEERTTGATAWSVSLNINTSDNSIDIQVVGDTGNSINWIGIITLNGVIAA